MSKILVAGIMNMETSVNVSSFPVNDSPISYPFFGIYICPGGAAYNIGLALKRLGDEVVPVSIVGKVF